MSISKDIIVDALRIRYDSYSAETVFELACQRAQLEGKTSFDGKELAVFRTALEKVGDRVGGVLARLDELGGGAPAPAKDAKQDSKPNEKPAEKSAEKSDGKPSEKAEAKSDSKPNETKEKPAEKPAEKAADKADAKPVEAKDKADSKPNEAKDKSDSKPNEKPAEAKR